MENITSIRKGRLFETFLCSTDASTYIEKRIVSSLQGNELKIASQNLANEVQITAHLSTLPFTPSLISRSASMFQMTYIEHLELDKFGVLEYISSSPTMQIELATKLFQFNTYNGNLKVKDTLFINCLKAFIRASILSRTFSLTQIPKILKAFFNTFLVQKSPAFLAHNDFTANNIFIGPDTNINIFDFDRTTVATCAPLRDIMYFLITSASITSWSWQYTVLSEYIHHYLHSSSAFSDKISLFKLYGPIHSISILYCLFYPYNDATDGDILKSNLAYLLNSVRTTEWLSLISEQCTSIQKEIA